MGSSIGHAFISCKSVSNFITAFDRHGFSLQSREINSKRNAANTFIFYLQECPPLFEDPLTSSLMLTCYNFIFIVLILKAGSLIPKIIPDNTGAA